MEMVEVVIRIPKQLYEDIKKSTVCGKHGVVKCDLLDAVADGIVLPVGHGDLIDRDKLVPDCEEQEIHDGEDWRNEYCGVSCMQIEMYTEVLVEADGGAE